MEKQITLKQVGALRSAFISDKEGVLRMNGAAKAGIDAACVSYNAPVRTPNVFSHEIKAGEVTAQNSSGRCWLFAAANVMRLEIMKKCNLETFELSQSHLFFWDKFEKANFFLESILDTLGEERDSRLVSWLLSAPFGDGGQWDMIVALVEKYGVVPKSVMPESHSSSASGRMNKFLTLKAREFAKELRDAHRAGASLAELRGRKEKMLAAIFRILCICLGTPPERFDFECRGKAEKDKDKNKENGDKKTPAAGAAGEAGGKPKPELAPACAESGGDGRFVRDLGITPVEFFQKYVGTRLDDYVSLINAPTADKPYYSMYTVAYLGNVVGGRPIRYLNLPVECLKRVAAAQVVDGEAVWFGSDVGQMLDRERGLMAMDTYDIENLLGTPFPLDKAARLDYGESLMTHAMVLMGVNIVGGKPTRWRVENSWGEKNGEKGWFRMSDDWFDEYVYQVVVDKKYLTDEERAALKKEPVVLKPWDPMGSLAL